MERATATEFEAGQAFPADASAPMWEVPDRPGEQRAAIFGGPSAPPVSPAAASSPDPSQAPPPASAATPASAPESAFDPEADLEDRFPQAPQTNRDAWRGIETPGSASTLAKPARSGATPPRREEPVMIDLGTPSGVSAEPRGLRALLAGLTGRAKGAKGAGTPKPPKQSRKKGRQAADENPWAAADGLSGPEPRGSDVGTHGGGRPGVNGASAGAAVTAVPNTGGPNAAGPNAAGPHAAGPHAAGPHAGDSSADSASAGGPQGSGVRGGERSWPAPVPQNGPAFGGVETPSGADFPAFDAPAASAGGSGFSAFGGPSVTSTGPASDMPGAAVFPAGGAGIQAGVGGSATGADNPADPDNPENSSGTRSWGSPASWPSTPTPFTPATGLPAQAPVSWPDARTPEPPVSAAPPSPASVPAQPTFAPDPPPFQSGASSFGAGQPGSGAEASAFGAGQPAFGAEAQVTGAVGTEAHSPSAPMWGTAPLETGAGTAGAGKPAESGSGSEWFTHVEPRLSDPSAPSGPAWVETPKSTGATSQNWTELTLSAPTSPPGAATPSSPATQSGSATQSGTAAPTSPTAPLPGQVDRGVAWNEPTRNGPIWTTDVAPPAAKPWTEAESQNGWAERPPVVDLWADPDGKSWTTTKPATSDAATPDVPAGDVPAGDAPAPAVPTSRAPRSKSAASEPGAAKSAAPEPGAAETGAARSAPSKAAASEPAASRSEAPESRATARPAATETPVAKSPVRDSPADTSAAPTAGVPGWDEPSIGGPRGDEPATGPGWDASDVSRRNQSPTSHQNRHESAAAPGWDEPAARDADDPYAMYRRPGVAAGDETARSRHAAADDGATDDDGDRGWQEIPRPSWSDQPATGSWDSGPSWADGAGSTSADRGTRETPPGRAERVGEAGTDVPRPVNGWTAGHDDRSTGLDRTTGPGHRADGHGHRTAGHDDRPDGTLTTGRDQVPGHDRSPTDRPRTDGAQTDRFQPAGNEQSWTAVPAPPPHLATQPPPGPDRPAPPGRRAGDRRRRDENPRHGDRSSESYPRDVIDLGGARPRSRRAKVLVTLGIVVMAVAVVGGMLTALRSVTGLNLAAAGDRPHAISAPLDGRKKLAFDLVSGVTSVTVISDDLQGDLYRVSTPEDSSIRPQAIDQGERVQLQMFETGDTGPNLVEIRLSSEVAWDLRLTGGATEHVIDFSKGGISGFDMLGGATRLELTLPAPDASVKLKVSSGLSQFVLRTPQETPSRLRFGAGADSVTLRGDGRGRAAPNSRFTPKAWEGAERRYDIDIAAGVGTFTLE